MNDMNELIDKIEALDWTIEEIEPHYFELGKFSPAGHDFHFCVESEGSREGFVRHLYNAHKTFDPSYEAYLWLDSSGHGTNGAPHDMLDVYEDMVACQESILSLYKVLQAMVY